MTNPSVVLKYWSIEKELQCRCGCGRYNYDPNFLIRLTAFRIISANPIGITSGGRCIKHNRHEGGVENSLHQCETKPATAVDGYSDNNKQLYQSACISGLFNEVEWHKTDGKDFVHIGFDPNQKGNSFKII